MIFLFDKFKKLKGTVRNRHTISLLYERERNGLYTVSAEIPLKITDKKTVYNYHKKVKDSDFLGHYDREGRFQLHKIASVDIEGSSIFIKGVHLFFDEAKAGAIIQERRFRDSEIIDGARVAFDSIGWSVVDFDVSDTEDYIFYNVSPLEARAILVETFGFEFDYWLDFDGKNIRNKQISVKREMGKDSNKRYNYGHNVLNIKVEQDYSEIYTAVIGRGKGEDLGDDAYGRRIEFTDVEWKTPTHPMNKPKGSRILHDENATQLFGYHEDGKVSPRTKVEIFEDIEDPAKLLRASYEWLKENSVPKAVFSLEVPDGDGLDLGDKVHVIYRDIDLVKHTRVTKVVDDLVSGNRDVEFGDTAYFKTDRRLSGVKAQLKQVGGSMSSRISRLKAEFDRRFDNEVQQWKDDFEQALIDAEAAVAVMRAEMTAELATVRKEMTDRFELEKAVAYEEAQRNYDAIADRITNVVDSTRTEMNTAFEASVKESKEFASAEAEAKAQAVQSNLEIFETKHSNLISDLEASVSTSFESINSEVLGLSSSLGTLGESLEDVKGTLTNTKTQLENKIVETEKALNKVGEDLGNAKTDLQKQLDEARAELDGLEVGTRNLIPDSHFYAGVFNGWSNIYGVQKVENHILKKEYTGESGAARIERTFGGLEVGETYTLSLRMRTDVDISWHGFLAATKIKESDTSASKDFKLYSVTFEVTSTNTVFIRGYQSKAVVGSYTEIDWFTLVKGNIPTLDWTPAPEDTEQKITNINQTITNIEGELSTKVEQTEVDALKGTVTAQGTLLTQTAEEVSSKAEKSVVDTLTGRVTNTESSVTQNAEEIAKKLTKSVYDEDKKDTDAKITQWSNLTTETAEGLEQTISRVSNAEGNVTKAQADIKANADEIATKVSSTEFNSLSGKVSDNSSAITQTANEVKSKVTQAEVDYSMTHIDNGSIKTVKDVANYFNSQSSVTGALLIKTNLTGRAMSRVFIKGYNYSTNNSNIDVVISFYNFSTSILNHSYTSTGSKEIERVRLFRDSDGVVNILLNDFDSTWQYPAIMVDRFDMSYVTNWSWGEDWEMSVVDSMPEDVAYITEVQGQDYGSIVTKHETDIVQNAREIALKATQSDLNSVTGRVSTAESQLSVQAGQIALRATKKELEGVDGRVSATESSLTVMDDEISSVVGKVDGNTKSISSVLQDTKSIKSTIASIEKDLVSQGSEIDQALDSITNKVWLGDVGGRNLLPKTVFPDDSNAWNSRGTDINAYTNTTRGLTDYLWVNRYGGLGNRYMAVLSPLLTEDIVEGHEYTIQFKTAHRVNVREKFSYVYLMNEDGAVNQPTFDSNQTVIEIGENDYNGRPIQLHTISVKANFSGRARVLIGTHSVDAGDARFYVKEPKIEKGKATAYSRAPEDFLQMSELKITPGYWQLGSTRIDGDSVSSVLRGTPDSIDAIVSEMNLTGNLNVKGQIETIAMSAVRGDFADLFADRVKAGDVDIDNISGRTAWFERLYTLNANIERLTAQFVFTDAIHAKSLDAIEANIGRVRTAFLEADVIKGSHIAANTVEIKHLTGYDAILETLMARTVFSNQVRTLSIDAVEANIGSLRTQILTSNVIKSSHIAGGTALIDKIFSSNAMFERMMAKSGFVRTLNTVSIDTDQLTIRRADGGVLMSQGTQKFGSPIITKPFPDTGVEFDGTNYVTTLRSSKTFERAYGEHAGRYANFSFRIGLDWSAASASTYMRIVIRPGTTPSGVTVPLANERFIVYRGEQKSETISVRLPVPTFGAISWTLEFYREGDNVTNPITVRSERCWISA